MARPCLELHKVGEDRNCRACQWIRDPGPRGRKYRQIWGEPEPESYQAINDRVIVSTNDVAARTAQPHPCRHRGAEGQRETCGSCGGNVQIKTFSCALHGRCHLADRHVEGVRPCATCADREQSESLLLINRQCPGDIVVMTAAVEMLRQQHPGRYVLAVECPHPSIFENNPHVFPRRASKTKIIEMHYNDTLNRSNQVPVHFLHGYVEYLAGVLGINLALTTNRPHLYLSAREEQWPDHLLPDREPYALVVAGVKGDYTTKGWGAHNYQEVASQLGGEIRFVQVGNHEGRHPPLSGVVNLVGKTTVRDVIHLARHATFGLGPSTFLQHVFAALERPYVCLLGGREALTWTHYHTQVTLATNSLPCCRTGGCWKNKTVQVDGDMSLCERPIAQAEPVPECLAVFTPEDVARECRKFLPNREPLPRYWSTTSRLFAGPIKAGVVFGTYGSPVYIAMQLKLREKYWPDVPCLVVDDGSRHERVLAGLCSAHGVEFVTHRHLGHQGGDLNVFGYGLRWARDNGLDLLVKISRRWMFLKDWRPELFGLCEKEQGATYSNVCRTYGFGFRTECVGMHVRSWMDGGMLQDIHDRTKVGRWDLLPEQFVHIHAQRVAGRHPGFVSWSAMGEARHAVPADVLWHNQHSPGEYASLASSLGLVFPEEELRAGGPSVDPVYSITGDVGDLIYALPSIRHLGGGTIRLCSRGPAREPFTQEKAGQLEQFLKAQTYVSGVEYGDTPGSVDLNGFRASAEASRSVIRCLSDFLGLLPFDQNEAWLVHPMPTAGPPVIFARSPRVHGRNFPWAKAVEKYRGRCAFVGLPEEHASFVAQFGQVPYHPTKDWWEAGAVIAQCRLFLGNMSAPLAMAHGLGVPRLVGEMPTLPYAIATPRGRQGDLFPLDWTGLELPEIP
jgi:ADP-heptose:LPS heptosyltransferase